MLDKHNQAESKEYHSKFNFDGSRRDIAGT